MSLSRRQFGKAALAATGVAGCPRAAWAAGTAYVFAYFTESPDQSAADYGLHLAVSRDGLNWAPLNQNNPVATPTAGQQGLRDPQIHRKLAGAFLVIATDLKGLDFGTTSQYLHVWDSAGLTAFTGYRRLRMHNRMGRIDLDPDDGSSVFRADATFHRVAGLADGGWSSFRSHNFPTHHLRHQGYVPRIDPVSSSSSATDRQDATFRVVS